MVGRRMTGLLLEFPQEEHHDSHGRTDSNVDEKAEIKSKIEGLTVKIEEIEKKVNEVLQNHASLLSKMKINLKDRDREKSISMLKKQQQTDAAKREAATIKRMSDLIRQCGTILRQITSHKWAWPFMEPVDVKGLNLHDYYDVIKKPMDLGTIRSRMEAKDGSGYKHVQHICDDVRLVFSNAMTYNQEGTDVHVMAKTLSEKFEEKWKTSIEPKLIEEESKRRQEEKAAQQRDLEIIQLAEEEAVQKQVSELNNQLNELNAQLEVLREEVAPHCRSMTTEEKRQLGERLSLLSPEDLSRAIQLISQRNPDVKAASEEVVVDMDAQDTSTLWRLQHFVRSVMMSRKDGVASSPGRKSRKGVITENLSKSKKRSRKAST